jgi:hypothetical protein
VAGGRSNGDGSISSVGTYGFYWSSTVFSANSRYLNFHGSFASMGITNRAVGLSVRCLKD